MYTEIDIHPSFGNFIVYFSSYFIILPRSSSSWTKISCTIISAPYLFLYPFVSSSWIEQNCIPEFMEKMLMRNELAHWILDVCSLAHNVCPHTGFIQANADVSRENSANSAQVQLEFRHILSRTKLFVRRKHCLFQSNKILFYWNNLQSAIKNLSNPTKVYGCLWLIASVLCFDLI